ncbi:MAG: serine/threonine protein kinase [Actinobacteria bacterium]|nr:MAG: serine/threonine protein kinase [Actinomycetota bacterium]
MGGSDPPGPNTGSEVERPTTTEEERTARLADAGEPDRTRRRFPGPDQTAALGDRPTGSLGHDRLVLDRYRLERRLGAGGFGVVWLAFDEKLEREVAVKVIQREGDEPVPVRAAREARVAARLNHPGIVSLYELGEDEDAMYLVSELVPGRTLAELIRAGAVSDADVARIGVALCDALAHAHDRKVIHRDVKPQNVIVVADPAAGAGFAKLADFGVAHLAVADPLTRTGDVVGTLAYMAPEQAEGARVSTSADVYALALTLYEAWAGANPVRGPSPAATARRLGRALPSLAAYRRDLPYELCAWVDAALDPVPERRPSLEVLRDALASAAPGLADARGLSDPTTSERVGLQRTVRLPSRLAGPAGLPRGRAWDVATRAAAGLAAGGLMLAGLESLGPHPRFSPAAAAATTAILVALLPRIGWLVAAAGFVGWLGWELRDGTALVVAAALLPVPVLLPRAGKLWSVPVLAPLLGTVGLGPAFVALAGLATTTARRAGLAAAGFLWLAVAELLGSHALLFGAPADAVARSSWAGSAGDAVSSPTAATIALWAVFAAALPFLVRGRTIALDIAGAAAWAAGLVAAHHGIAQLAGHHLTRSDARGAVAGAILGALTAVGARAIGLGRAGGEHPPVAARGAPPVP